LHFHVFAARGDADVERVFDHAEVLVVIAEEGVRPLFVEGQFPWFSFVASQEGQPDLSVFRDSLRYE
jgi:hypothetical protein